MNRSAVRRIAFAAAAVVGVLLLAAVIFTATFDVNRYKPQIERAVQERTGRTLAFDGDLALTLFPRLAVKLPPTTLSEPGGATVFARLQSARASVALLPLLRRRFEVDGVRIDGLQATVVRRKDGTTSIDDLLKPQQAAAPAPGAEPATAAGGVTLGAVELKNADVTWRDLAAGRTVRLHEFDLSAGRYAPPARLPVQASASVSSDEPAVAMKVKLQADVEWTEAGGLRGIRGLSLKGDGTLKQQPVTVDVKADQLTATADAVDVRGVKFFANARGQGGAPIDLQLSAPRLQASPAQATGERIEATYARRGADPLEMKVLVDGVRGTAAQLEAPQVKITGSVRSAQRAIRFDATTALVAAVKDRTLRIERASGDVLIEDPALGKNPLRLPLTASGTVDGGRETVALQLETRGEGLSGRARFGVTGFAAPRIAFDVDADQVDADRYFLSAVPKDGGGAGGAGKASTPAGPTAGNDAKVEFGALRGVNAAGNVRIARLRIKGTDVSDVKATVKANDGRVDVAPFALRVHGGSIDGRLGLDARANRVSIGGTASGLQLRRVAGSLGGGRAALEGRANATFDLASAGATVGQMKRALGGSLALDVRDGALVGIDLADVIGTASGFLQSRGRQTGALDENRRTPFSQLSASVRIKDGVATNDDLKAKSAQLDIAGNGRMDLVSTEIDYGLRAQVLPGPATERTALRSLAGLTVPVKVTGPVERPSYAVDWAPIAAEALLKRATGRSGTPPVNEVIQGLGDLLRRKK